MFNEIYLAHVIDRGYHPQNQSMFMFPIGMQGRIQDFPEGAPTYYLAKFSRKLHTNEENWTEGGRVQNFTM